MDGDEHFTEGQIKNWMDDEKREWKILVKVWKTPPPTFLKLNKNQLHTHSVSKNSLPPTQRTYKSSPDQRYAIPFFKEKNI